MKSETNNAVKHAPTPGPWIVEGFGFTGVKVKTEWNTVYGQPNPICQVFSQDALEYQQANARLIAAAPELLEACKALLEEWKSRTAMIESCDLTEEEDRAVELAESAIAKATGETL